MDISSLLLQNPWWDAIDRIEADPKIRAFEHAAYKWSPELLHTIDLSRDLIYSLRGPRQVGKTTFVKLLIRHLLATQTSPPQRIFYYQCDLIPSEQALAELLLDYLEFRTPFPPGRTFLFIDEISAVRGWQKAVKHLADLGRFEDCTLLVTGSHTVDIQQSLELLPGRRGDASSKLDLTLLPLTFREFVDLRLAQDPAQPVPERYCPYLQPASVVELIAHLRQGETTQLAISTTQAIPYLNYLLDQYLLTGGFITTINEYLTTGMIREYLYDVYLTWLMGDLHKLGRSETTLAQIAQAILETFGTPVSSNGLAQKTSVGSHHTVADYLDILSHNFVLFLVPQYDPNTRQANLRKNRKIYFADIFIRHAIRWWIGRSVTPFDLTKAALADPALKGALVENLVGAFLRRRADHLYYWHDRYQNELDFLTLEENQPLGIEVKFREQISKKELGALAKFQHGIVLTKKYLEAGPPFPFVPVCLYLLQ